MLKFILVSATGGPGDEAVFGAALQMARPFGAHLAFLHARVDVTEVLVSMASGGMGVGTGAMDQAAIDGMEADGTAIQTRALQSVEAFCALHAVVFGTNSPTDGMTASFTAETGSISRWIAEHGRFADLIVVGGPAPGREAAREAQEAALMESGRPTLIVPAVVPEHLLATVMVAWHDTPEVARALTAAMPMLELAQNLVVVTIDEADEQASNDTADQLGRSLLWHNRSTIVRHVAAGGRAPVDAVLEEARTMGATLIVMGGFGHSRLRELLFGGFTQTVLDGIDRPVLIMH